MISSQRYRQYRNIIPTISMISSQRYRQHHVNDTASTMSMILTFLPVIGPHSWQSAQWTAAFRHIKRPEGLEKSAGLLNWGFVNLPIMTMTNRTTENWRRLRFVGFLAPRKVYYHMLIHIVIYCIWNRLLHYHLSGPVLNLQDTKKRRKPRKKKKRGYCQELKARNAYPTVSQKREEKKKQSTIGSMSEPPVLCNCNTYSPIGGGGYHFRVSVFSVNTGFHAWHKFTCLWHKV